MLPPPVSVIACGIRHHRRRLQDGRVQRHDRIGRTGGIKADAVARLKNLKLFTPFTQLAVRLSSQLFAPPSLPCQGWSPRVMPP